MTKSSGIARIPNPVNDQIRVKESYNPDNPPAEYDPDEHALFELISENGREGYMLMRKPGENEFISPGLNNRESFNKLVRTDAASEWYEQPEDFEPHDPGYDHKPSSVYGLRCPSLEEIDEFGEQYQEKVENAEGEELEEILEEAWENAAEFVPEKRERLGNI